MRHARVTMWRILEKAVTLTSLLAISVVASSASASGRTVLTGQVIDGREQPMAGVSVGVLDGSTLILSSVTDASGTYELVFSTPTSNRVAVEVHVEGYRQLRHTVVLERPNIRIRPLQVKPLDTIEVTKVVVLDKKDGRNRILEIGLHNANTKSASSAQGFRIVGTAAPQRTCMDGGAQLTFQLSDLLIAAGYRNSGIAPMVATLKVTTGQELPGKSLEVQAKGTVNYRDCAVTSITVELDHLFSMSPNEFKNVWIEVPAHLEIELKASKQRRVLRWEPMIIGIQTIPGLFVERKIK